MDINARIDAFIERNGWYDSDGYLLQNCDCNKILLFCQEEGCHQIIYDRYLISSDEHYTYAIFALTFEYKGQVRLSTCIIRSPVSHD